MSLNHYRILRFNFQLYGQEDIFIIDLFLSLVVLDLSQNLSQIHHRSIMYSQRIKKKQIIQMVPYKN